MTQENKDIQPQAEPYIVKSHDIHIDADYADWIADIKSCYLFYAEKIKKLKQLVSVINAEKMHQAGAELINPKRQQSVGDLQFTVNHGMRSKSRAIGIACTPSTKGVATFIQMMSLLIMYMTLIINISNFDGTTTK